jgi:hypothetical protein
MPVACCVVNSAAAFAAAAVSCVLLCIGFYAEAVVVLREDLPLLFQQEMRFHIYREDITFR